MAIQLDDVYAAAERIAALTFRTPLRLSEWLSGPDANVFLKLETVQPTLLVQDSRRLQRRAAIL